MKQIEYVVFIRNGIKFILPKSMVAGEVGIIRGGTYNGRNW